MVSMRSEMPASRHCCRKLARKASRVRPLAMLQTTTTWHCAAALSLTPTFNLANHKSGSPPKTFSSILPRIHCNNFTFPQFKTRQSQTSDFAPVLPPAESLWVYVVLLASPLPGHLLANTKPKVHNGLHCHQRTEPWLHLTVNKILRRLKIWFSRCASGQTDRQTDRHTYRYTSHF